MTYLRTITYFKANFKTHFMRNRVLIPLEFHSLSPFFSLAFVLAIQKILRPNTGPIINFFLN